ncbi:MAG: stage II sporulation protein M [Crenarchaeota archaeon]|nr:stage II sporulation protein M [Thermoproteota archaeon]MDW8034190.1 stage II sporulation protein M [Nitrososphaerota archaeon]
MIVENQDSEYGSYDGKDALPPLHKKWELFPITILVLSLTFVFSSMIPVEKGLAEEITESLKGYLNVSILDIFMNNLVLSIIMMIPIFGFIFSIFSSSLNGMVVSAFSIATGSNPLRIVISILSSPEGVLEILAFGLASAQSLAGFFAIIGKRFRKELKGYLTTVGIVLILLVIAALLEAIYKSKA